MDAPHVFSSRTAADRGGMPVPLEGEIIPPRGRAKVDADPVQPRAPAPEKSGIQPANILIGTLVAALLGLSAAGGYYVWDRTRSVDATAVALRQLQHDLGTLRTGVESLKGNTDLAHQDETIRNLRKSVDTLKSEIESARSASTSATAQLAAKLDKPDHDSSGKLADIAARLDKLENPGAKLSDIAARLDRIERQVSSPATTGSIAAPVKPPVPTSVQQVSVVAPAEKPAPKPATLGNYIVRDVYDGIALVEGRSGGIREVTPGEFLPGAGEVRSIERRGRTWIVVTSRGIIDDSTW